MPSAKDGIGISSGPKIESVPPPVPTCPPPLDSKLNDNEVSKIIEVLLLKL